MERVLTIFILTLLTAGTACAAKLGLPDPVVPDCLGVNIHFVGSEPKQVDQIAAGGFRYVRMDYVWGNVEKERGRYDFRPYDELLSTLKERGIRPLFILCYSNKLYDDGLSPHTDAGREAYADFARAAAAHFKGEGVLWEIWNEPNGIHFWWPEPNVDNYVKLARAAYAALKEGDSQCTVLAPALAGWDFTFLEAAFAKGLLECTDVISVHPYGAAKPEDAALYFSRVRELAAKYGPKGKVFPVVSGEWGYPAANGMTVEQQGEFLARQFVSNMMNDVRLSIWYDWHDDGPDPKEPEHHFGTVYLDYSEKPAYRAMRTLSRELGGYSFANRMSTPSDGDFLLLFRKGKDFRLAAWTTGKPHSAKVPVDVSKLGVVSLTGRRENLPVDGKAFTLELTGAVQYVEPATASARWGLEAAWKVSAHTLWDKGKLIAEIVSESPVAKASLSAKGDGLQRKSLRSTSGAPLTQRLRTAYVGSDARDAYVTVTLESAELGAPLERTVRLDASAVPVLEVLPPAGKELVVAVRRPPARSDEMLSGQVTIGNARGASLLESRQAFTLECNQESALLHFRLAQEPAQPHSFSCTLDDGKGNDLVRLPVRRYAVVETFADGKVGEKVDKYDLLLDGDSKVPAQAKLAYVDAPFGGPSKVCAKLDYGFGGGWRFVRIAPRTTTPIPDSPRSVKLWIRGDAGMCDARLRFTDSGDQTFQPDYGKIDFSGWKCLSADMSGAACGRWGGKNDGLVDPPTTWNTLFLLDTPGGRKAEGAVYLGSMMLCYD